MSTLDTIKLAGQKAKGRRPYFMPDRADERNMSIAMAVAGELAVMRERLDSIERLLEQDGVLSRDRIEAFRPDAAAEEERMRWHQEYVARILRFIQQEREDMESAFAQERPEDMVEKFAKI